ncbi:SanA protein [Marinospirillum celere]|uniref:SanA protein n=1 Tax=Marinospirillum celere TaxID=1122252 RepID=A0A1I1FEQ2_9GAMM|nr:ElyC/SanA/YdcF family protein [Marinospirillum celere]SFB97781.1 SanA protein [Marinospirillum celere]
MRRLLRKILLWWWRLLALAALTLTLLLGVNAWFVGKTVDRINKTDAACTSMDVGILFGTSQYLRSGLPNPHYYGRINEAARLYREGKIQHLLVSGDNRTRYYNEPKRMQQDLIYRGLPETAMSLDHAGFSTFDTLKRAKQVFNVNQALLITQDYHLPRALFIAESLGIEAYGCQATGPSWTGMKNILLRELAARLRTLGDLYIWKREPRILDDPQPLDF